MGGVLAVIAAFIRRPRFRLVGVLLLALRCTTLACDDIALCVLIQTMVARAGYGGRCALLPYLLPSGGVEYLWVVPYSFSLQVGSGRAMTGSKLFLPARFVSMVFALVLTILHLRFIFRALPFRAA